MSYKRVIISGFGGPEMLKLVEETALPEPKPGEVRIKVLVTSAAFTDVMIRWAKRGRWFKYNLTLKKGGSRIGAYAETSET